MYRSLDTIPFKMFIRIVENLEFTYLLANEDCELLDYSPEEILLFNQTWNKIYNSYLQLKPNEEEKKTLTIKSKIEYLESKYKLILMCCNCLRFDYDPDIIKILINFGYTITDLNYYNDIDRIERESENLLVKCENYIKQLPEVVEVESNNNSASVDDMLASISTVLGIYFDFNLVSYSTVNSYLKQVKSKISALESQITNKE